MILSAVTAALVGIISFLLIRGYVNTQAQAQLRVTAESIEQQLRPYVKERETDQIRALAEMLGLMNNMRIRVLDVRQRLLTDTHPGGVDDLRERAESTAVLIEEMRGKTLPWVRTAPLGRITIPAPTREDHVQPGTRRIEIEPAREGRVLTFPVQENGGLLGFIELQHPPDLADETLSQSRLYLFLAGLAAVAVAIAIGGIMGKRMTSPLLSLNSAVRQIEGGELSVRAHVRRNDEIGELATSVNRMAATIESSIDSLRAERDALKAFAEDASHELKTPVTALKTFNELLLGKSGEDPKRRREFLVDSKLQLDRMQWIVQALITLTRLDAEVVEPALEETDLIEVISDLVAGRSGEIEGKAIKIERRSSGNPIVISDRNYLNTAIGNILDNAIKYAPTESVISIETSNDDIEFTISITDRGPGISDDDFPHIFRRFYRSRNAYEGGSGLGLSLAESIVKFLGGQISVTTEPGNGATFRISIPTYPSSDKPDS